jgi:phosphoribosyl 1,2-cyclic phosphodiesterase
MKVTLWGTRGSLAAPGADTVRYGGNTACVQVRSDTGTHIILDAGTGIRPLGEAIPEDATRVDVLLSHLHMDHILGLGFFGPLYRPGLDVHIWGPSSTTLELRERLARYLSPPLFPVRLRDLPCNLEVHDVPLSCFEIGDLNVCASLVCHPGPTVGYRIMENGHAMAYLPDHEPALGWREFPGDHGWTSGFECAEGADLLIHDAQYTEAEYQEHVGWGHSSIDQTLAFAAETGIEKLVTFHHDPTHADVMLDQLLEDSRNGGHPFELIGGTEGMVIELTSSGAVAEAAPVRFTKAASF